MRILPLNTIAALEKFEDFIYCYHIKLQNGQDLYLTESSNIVIIDNMQFIPNSGLTFQDAEFNDSAQNYIILKGIFELEGINSTMDLTGATVKIFLALNNNINYHFITYYCTLYIKRDLEFQLRLESEAVKYNQTLLNSFSKTCRANFGDTKCQVDKKLYTYLYNIKEMHNNTLAIASSDKENGYFTRGEAIFNEELFKSKIVSQIGNVIQLEDVIPANLKCVKEVSLVVGCDKNFISCCNKFNNAVNFRGEPLVPDSNFIKFNLHNFNYE